MKKSIHPKLATKILNRQGDTSLQPLLGYADYLHQQSKRLRQSLSEPIASHIALANIKNGVATIVVDSSSWLGKVRYLAPIIRQLLTSQGLTISRVEFKTDPSHHLARKIKPQPAVMSTATGKLLHSFAESINNPELQTALLRLSKHGK